MENLKTDREEANVLVQAKEEEGVTQTRKRREAVRHERRLTDVMEGTYWAVGCGPLNQSRTAGF